MILSKEETRMDMPSINPTQFPENLPLLVPPADAGMQESSETAVPGENFENSGVAAFPTEINEVPAPLGEFGPVEAADGEAAVELDTGTQAHLSLGSKVLTSFLLGLTLFGGIAATATPAMAAGQRGGGGRQVTRTFNGGGMKHNVQGNRGFNVQGNRGFNIQGNRGFTQQRQGSVNIQRQPQVIIPNHNQGTRNQGNRNQGTHIQAPNVRITPMPQRNYNPTPPPAFHPGQHNQFNSGGRTFRVPSGGWVTQSHHRYDDLRTFYHQPGMHPRGGVVVMNNYFNDFWGPGWHQHHHGIYQGSNFWLGFAIGALLSGHNYAQYPVYIMSPMTMTPYGMLQPPNPYSTLNARTQLEISVLSAMANPTQDAYNPDYSAGLYLATPYFNPGNPGMKLSPQNAYNMLRHGNSVYFHPPHGSYEQISDLGDLDAYLYSPESQNNAPQQMYLGQ